METFFVNKGRYIPKASKITATIMQKKKVSKSVAKKKLKNHIDNTPITCVFTPTESVVWYWWHVINKAVFNNELPRPIITVRKLRGAWGTCNGENITISATITNRHLFIATICHEMCHQWQHHFGTGINGGINHGPVFRNWDHYFKQTFGIVL
jgi:hypothetical protein